MKKTYLILLTLFFVSCATQQKIGQDLSGLSLPKYSKQQLEDDFDLEVKALKEAHTGLYWYSSKEEFDAVTASRRLKIRDSLNVLEFYNIVAPIVAFTKEDHCDITLPDDAGQYLAEHGKFMPLTVISLDEKIYVLNNPDDETIVKGNELLEINGIGIQEIYSHIFNTYAADGFVRSSKVRYLDYNGLSKEYAKTIGQPDSFDIVTRNAKTGKRERHHIKAQGFAQLKSIISALRAEGIIKSDLPPATIKIEPNIALLTINTFSNSSYKAAGMDFKAFIKTAFDSIAVAKPKNLIIDMRENGGGSEGNEDYLFSFLTDKPYTKYKYVQASGFTYSFLEYTYYSQPEGREDLEADLREEHYLAEDGRILRKPDVEPVAPLQPNPYKGNIYILTSGWTYSGGAEFASLMREHTDAVFIGEEVGGGYYGNTSGYSIELTLPNTGIKTELPLLKFVLDVSPKVPPGRGVLPDYEVQADIEQFLNGYDAEMEYARILIKDKH